MIWNLLPAFICFLYRPWAVLAGGDPVLVPYLRAVARGKDNNNKTIGNFRVVFRLCFKASPSAKPFMEISFTNIYM